MKKLFIILLLSILSIAGYSQQIDYNIYTGLTKKAIIFRFKDFGYNYTSQQKMYVKIDSTGNWQLDNNYYTWLIYYSFDDKKTMNRVLFMFNPKGICVKYFILMPSLAYFWDYFDYYNRNFKYMQNLDWENNDIRIHLKAKSNLNTTIYIEKK